MKENKLLISVFLGSLLFLVLAVVVSTLVSQSIIANPNGLTSQITGLVSLDISDLTGRITELQDTELQERLRQTFRKEQKLSEDELDYLINENWELMKQISASGGDFGVGSGLSVQERNQLLKQEAGKY